MKLFPPILLSRPALTRFIRARKARYSRSAGMIFILLVLVVSALIARRGAFAVTSQVECQPGSLDTSFNGTGIVTTPISERYDVGRSVAIQADGKIVEAGQSDNDFAVVRYNTDGSLDTSFNGTGTVSTDISDGGGDLAYSVAIQGDGKIVVAGYTYIDHAYADFVVVRYNSDGSLDTSFNGTGIVITDISGNHDQAYSVAIQSDGKIVVAGESYIGSGWDFALARYNTDGSLDTSLNGTGKVTTPIGSGSDEGRSVAIQADGKIVLSGDSYNGTTWDFALVRYNSDGSLDTSPNGTGKVTTHIGNSAEPGQSVAIQNDGKIVVAGSTSNGSSTYDDFALVRYNSDGSLDTSFNGTGKVTTAIGTFYDDASSVTIQGDGKIVVAGYSYNVYPDFAVVRYNNDGSLDTSFNGTGKVTTAIGSNYDDAYSVATQSDGKIVAAGYGFSGGANSFAVVRYNNSGSLDTSFGSTGKVITFIGMDAIGQSMAIQSDGKIVVGGSSLNISNYDFAVARYNTNGALDGMFGLSGTVTTAVGSSDDFGQSVAIQSDGKIVVAGYSYNGSNYDVAVVRYTSNGSLDTSFNGTGKVTRAIGSSDDIGQSVAIQSDGKLVVAGYSYNGSDNDVAVVRYNSDGSLDSSFNGTGKVVTPVGSSDDAGESVAIQSDGKIVIAGSSNNGSDEDVALVRYNSNGSLDTAFNGTGKVTTSIGSGDDVARALAIQNDGKIIGAGSSNNGSDNDVTLVRYNNDGSLALAQ